MSWGRDNSKGPIALWDSLTWSLLCSSTLSTDFRYTIKFSFSLKWKHQERSNLWFSCHLMSSSRRVGGGGWGMGEGCLGYLAVAWSDFSASFSLSAMALFSFSRYDICLFSWRTACSWRRRSILASVRPWRDNKANNLTLNEVDAYHGNSRNDFSSLSLHFTSFSQR